MSNITLLLAFHNHQPDGNFDHVFAQGYDDCYRPLLDLLADFPTVRCALHHTGPLLEWIDKHRPDYLADLRRLVERGQVEVLGGGFYEPMLAVLPEADAHGQLTMMRDFCHERFGVRPRGMWLAERVWEPALAERIARGGYDFTLLDDTHFRYAGLTGPLSGWYVTERAGTPLGLFPIEKEMRYAIPFKSVDDTIAALHQLGRDHGGDLTVTYGDDGEKFGMWPGTKAWVWEKGWLRSFFTRLAEPGLGITTAHFGEVMDRQPPTGRVYLPTASYEEMGEWSLPAAAQRQLHDGKHRLAELDPSLADSLRPFLRGGVWQGFMSRYPEANLLHKKMIHVSRRLQEAAAAVPAADLRDAQRELYRAQCNCPYWHGLFGGLYLNSLRHAVYAHLIAAEEAADQAQGRLGDDVRVEHIDLDADFQREVVLANRDLWVAIKPDAGGGCFELDVRARRFNLANVLGRHPEGYHHKLLEALAAKRAGAATAHDPDAVRSIHDLAEVKDDTLGDLLHYDRTPRHGFLDHFFAESTSLDDLERARATELSDFAGAAYTIVESRGGAEGLLHLRRTGNVLGREVSIDKTITLRGKRLSCHWQIRGEITALFAPELPLTLLAGDAPSRRYHAEDRTIDDTRLCSRGVLPECARLELHDDWSNLRVAVIASGAPTIWRHPLETASQSEAGFERTYQGSIILPVWPIRQAQGGLTEVTLTVEVSDLHA